MKKCPNCGATTSKWDICPDCDTTLVVDIDQPDQLAEADAPAGATEASPAHVPVTKRLAIIKRAVKTLLGDDAPVFGLFVVSASGEGGFVADGSPEDVMAALMQTAKYHRAAMLKAEYKKLTGADL